MTQVTKEYHLEMSEANIQDENSEDRSPEFKNVNENSQEENSEQAIYSQTSSKDNPQTADMEVHHHGHVHHQKKWKEYLFQFLMLFLAVFLGFLAEYQLEHIIDHDKEKQYVQSFIQNIKDDTTSIARFIEAGKLRAKGLDSLLRIADGDISVPQNRMRFYRHIVNYLFSIQIFISNDATSTQLRNSGGYRLIRRKGVADSLTAYEIFVKAVDGQAAYYKNYMDQLFSIREEIVDLMVLRDTTYMRNGTFTDKPLPLIEADPKQLRVFKNKLLITRAILKTYNIYLEQLLAYASRLLPFLEKKYHLEND